jgi:hypothetical protein
VDELLKNRSNGVVAGPEPPPFPTNRGRRAAQPVRHRGRASVRKYVGPLEGTPGSRRSGRCTRRGRPAPRRTRSRRRKVPS